MKQLTHEARTEESSFLENNIPNAFHAIRYQGDDVYITISKSSYQTLVTDEHSIGAVHG